MRDAAERQVVSLDSVGKCKFAQSRHQRPVATDYSLYLRKPVLDLSGDVSRNASSHCLTASQKRIDVTAAQFARSR
jgi:hypothetical protein